jgi:hypothetical protein
MLSLRYLRKVISKAGVEAKLGRKNDRCKDIGDEKSLKAYRKREKSVSEESLY